MQRSPSTVTRNVLVACVACLFLMTVLYYMKRVEVSRLKKDLTVALVSTFSTDREEGGGGGGEGGIRPSSRDTV